MSVPAYLSIKLDQFLKHVQVAPTGGQAKLLIQSGQVMVNGDIELRRGRKLLPGDKVEVMGTVFVVDFSPGIR